MTSSAAVKAGRPRFQEMNNLFRSLSPALSIAGIVFLGTLAHLNSLGNGFQFDDSSFILNNPAIYHLSGLAEMWGLYPVRVIGTFSFALNYFFHGLSPFGYHLANLVIHLITSVMVWRFTALTLKTPGLKDSYSRPQAQILALTTAFIFVVHPLSTNVVNHITQRYTSLVALFFLSSLCCYIHARLENKKTLYGWAGLWAVLGILTKQTAVLIPFAILLYEFYFFKGPRGGTPPSRAARYIPALLITAVFFLLFQYALNHDLLTILSMRLVSQSHDGDIITAGNYALTQPGVILIYLKLFLWPHPLNFDYDLPLAHSFSEFRVWAGVLSISALAYLASRLFRKHPLISFGIFWFFLTLSVESSVLPISYVIAEYRTYLPYVGLCLALCAGLYELTEKDTRRFGISVSVIVLIFTVLSFNRNKVWKDEVVFWQDAVQKSPRKSRPYDNLGQAYLKAGDVPRAVENLNKALSLDPGYIHTYTNLANIYLNSGDLERAGDYLESARKISPRHAVVLNGLGLVAWRNRQFDQAREFFRQAIESPEKYAEPALNLAAVYAEEGDLTAAATIYRETLKKFPDKEFIYNHLIEIFLKQNALPQALDAGSELLAGSRDSKVLTSAGDLFAGHGHPAKALPFYARALDLDPRNKSAAINQGKIYGNFDQFDRAIEIWQKAEKFYPNDPQFRALIDQANRLKGIKSFPQ